MSLSKITKERMKFKDLWSNWSDTIDAKNLKEKQRIFAITSHEQLGIKDTL